MAPRHLHRLLQAGAGGSGFVSSSAVSPATRGHQELDLVATVGRLA